MRKRITVSTALSLMFIAITVTFCLTMIVSARLFESKVSGVSQKETMYSKVSEIDTMVRQHYYTALDETAVVDGLSAGYISGLKDSEAKYYTAAEVTALQNLSKGKRTGIGLEVQKDISGYYKVVKVDKDSPADIAEMKKDDMVTEINNTDVKNLNTQQVREMLTGEEGTSIKIEYLRDSEDYKTELTFSLYDAPSISYSLEGTVGYIKIVNFDASTASEVDYAVKNLISQGATGFALDVRNNASKEYQLAAEVADIFVKEGTTMNAQYVDNSQRVLFTSDKELVEQPLSVIVNGATGYASEMFAVILKDMGGAKLVGTTTMGKCTIQTLYRLSDGSGIEITTARLVPVATADYHNTGLLPDYEKALSAEQELAFYDMTISDDPQIQRAFEVVANLATQQSLQTAAQQAKKDPEDSSSVEQTPVSSEEDKEEETDEEETSSDAEEKEDDNGDASSDGEEKEEEEKDSSESEE